MGLRLILEGLAKSYPGRPVFSGINVEINEGKRLVISGPNGSGKSTLMRIICGFVRPTAGKVTFKIEDRNLGRLEIRPHIGLVSPDLVLYDELTVFENLMFFAGVAGLHFPIDILSAKLDRIGLHGRGSDLVGSYSSGMKQRLKYCLALLRDPELLLLDEPTANLDDEGKSLISDIIESHNGVVVIATNERTELRYGDEIVRLG